MKIEIELDELTKEEQETVKRLAEKAKRLYFVPNKQERYFFCHSGGEVLATFNDSIHDDFAISIGNCFRTREEAEEAKTRLQMQAKWKRLSLEAGEADNPWDGECGHWEVNYYVNDGINYDRMTTCQDGVVHFPTKNDLKAAIAELGEENVKKYILGVTE